MPVGIAVDKGFIFGRHPIDDKASRHCPEIDILIHDVLHYRPVFRLDEFVIVQQEAVLGMIQVKRNLVTDEFQKGIRNVMLAKRHLIDLAPTRGKRTTGVMSHSPGWLPPNAVLTAVVGFSDCPKKTDTLKTRLEEAYADPDFGDPAYTDHQRRWMMPDFIGSLQSVCAISSSPGGHAYFQEYSTINSEEKGTNTALQVLLLHLTKTIWWFTASHLGGAVLPPFQLPEDMEVLERFRFPPNAPDPPAASS